jgi:dihydrofolate synthase/folylpolyglutamate synthase
MTYDEALAWLDGLLNYERTAIPYAEIKLARIQALLARLGNPHRQLQTVLVAGTKGKGSTAAMLCAILRAAGERVGLYSKPHLVDYRERIQIDGVLIPKEALTELVAAVRPAVEAGAQDPWGSPTYFEVSVALALLHFLHEGVDRAVLEVGIGGRLDATNVCDPELSIITPISYDHTDVLGHTLTQIATEKAGIIRPGRPVVSAPQPEEARMVIAEVCERLGAQLVEVGRDTSYAVERMGLGGVEFTVTTFGGRYEGLHLPLLGRHQALNAAVALTAAEILLGRRCRTMGADEVRKELAHLEWPAREELLSLRPTVLVDVAHNPASIAALRATLEELFPDRRVVLLLGMIATHDPDPVAAIIAPVADEVITTTPLHLRPLAAHELAEVVRRYHRRVEAVPELDEALGAALERTGPEDVLVVAGSFFLAGPARERLLGLLLLNTPRAV